MTLYKSFVAQLLHRAMGETIFGPVLQRSRYIFYGSATFDLISFVSYNVLLCSSWTKLCLEVVKDYDHLDNNINK
jgi:hypothetical protein